MTELAIDVKGLTKRFGPKTAVDHIDIAVPEGQVWGFLGPNGSGKTTTIRMLCGLLSADDGQGTCLGLDFRTQPEAIKRQVGYMTQKFQLLGGSCRSARDLEFVVSGSMACRTAGAKSTRPWNALAWSNASSSLLPEQLSEAAGSSAWRWPPAHAARSQAAAVLDEPTAGVDPQARREFWEEIHALSETGLTVLGSSTHYMDEAERCDRIVYILNGQKSWWRAVRCAEVGRTVRPFDLRAGGRGCPPSVASNCAASPGSIMSASSAPRCMSAAMTAPPWNRRWRRIASSRALRCAKPKPSLEDVFIDLRRRMAK